jgi:hypothetical protein
MPLPAALPYILGGAQLLSGIFGKKPERPKYRIPGEAQESLDSARTLANNTVRPGNEEAVTQINQDAANATNSAQRVTGNQTQILGAQDRAGLIKSRAMLNNNALNSSFKYNAKLNLQNSLKDFAQYRDKAFQLNQMQPYQDKAQTKGALISSGIQNLFGASQDAGNMNMLREIYGLKGQGGFNLMDVFKKKGFSNIDASLSMPGIVS